ncbi:MAG: hypothetical protein HZC42_06910 [Candidatus Eisenbacteria bacterium]|nr:hypothetical protein [Candidatus Eisenbacteria bacterium]
MPDDRVALGSRFRKTVTNVGFAAYDVNSPTTIKLPVGFLWRMLNLRLTGSINISVAGTVKAEAPLGLIRKIEIRADGKTIHSVGGRDLFRVAHHLEGKEGEIVPPVGTGAAVAIAATIPLHFLALRKARPADSLFDSDPYKEIVLEITWAPLTAIYTGGTAALNSGAGVRAVLEETNDGHDEVTVIRTHKYTERSDVNSASSEFELEIPDIGIIEGFLLRVDRDDAPVDDIVNYISIESEKKFDHWRQVPWADAQRRSVQEFSVDAGTSGSKQIAGYCYVDLTEEGMLTTALNAIATRSLKIKLDVTPGGGTTRVIRATFVGYELKPVAEAA